MPGLIIGDCGKKMGLDGIDNGFIVFDQYRTSRESLLDRLSTVSPDGVYTCEMSDAIRFGLSLGALSAARLTLSDGAAKVGLICNQIALRYAAVRR